MLNLRKGDSVIFIDLTDNTKQKGTVLSYKNNLVEMEYIKNGQKKIIKQYRNQVSKNLRK